MRVYFFTSDYLTYKSESKLYVSILSYYLLCKQKYLKNLMLTTFFKKRYHYARNTNILNESWN